MNGLTDEERRRLLLAARKIYENKVMQVKGYEILAKKAKEGVIKGILQGISRGEARRAEFWSERIGELGGEPKVGAAASLREWRVGIMMRVLGPKGFFEWTVVGEADSIRDLAIQAENIRDKDNSEIWGRLASDERLHLERMKREVLGMEAWEIRGSGGLGEIIFGINDGLLSNFALVVGVFGAGTGSRLILFSGLAGLFGNALSDFTGTYLSAKSELEVLEREEERKEVKGKGRLEDEKEELIKFYQAEGFKREDAEALADRITAERELPMHGSTLEELGLAPKEVVSPLKAATLIGIFCALGALVPLLPFTFQAVEDALFSSVTASLATLLLVGALKTIFSRRSWVRSGLEMLGAGILCSVTTYLIGTLFSMIL